MYVDDLLIIGPLDNVTETKQKLIDHFNIKDFGNVLSILRIDIIYDITNGTLNL